MLYEYCAATEYLNSHWEMFFRPLFLLKLSSVYQHGLASARQHIWCVSTHSWGGVRSSATSPPVTHHLFHACLKTMKTSCFIKLSAIVNMSFNRFWWIGLMLATALGVGNTTRLSFLKLLISVTETSWFVVCISVAINFVIMWLFLIASYIHFMYIKLQLTTCFIKRKWRWWMMGVC